jgi:8-oxo-dGTP pyrophosphatase MutT (NUDIX family)
MTFFIFLLNIYVKFNDLVNLLVEKRDTNRVSKIIATTGGKILLLQKKNGSYELPGGHIEVGESPLDGAKREFEEETGISLKNPKQIASSSSRVLYKAKLNNTNIKISDEHKGYKFVSQKDIFKLPLSKWSKKDLAFLKQKEKSTIDENYADGKKKGKSRPGRVKRAGASCKGSVTELRKKAKKYGGEKGKMYQWCLNMKAGKKKSNK